MPMSPNSYSEFHVIDHGRDLDEDIQPGDLIRTGANLYPHFEVIAVNGEKVWVRNVQTGVDGFTPLDRCRKINGAPALDAI
jgi:hypothetical protein